MARQRTTWYVVLITVVVVYLAGYQVVRRVYGGLYDDPKANVTGFRLRIQWADWFLYHLYWPALKADEAATGRVVIRNTYPDLL